MAELRYKPPGPVAKQFMLDESFVRGLRGPVGSGKSVVCCIEIMRKALAQQPGPDGLRKSRWVVTRNTMPELKTTTIKTWLDWFPETQWGKFNWSPPFTHRIRAGDIDLEVIFLALDSDEDVKKLKSLELTGAWVNEAGFTPRAIVTTLTERVGRYPSMRDGGSNWYGVIMDTNAMDPDHWYPIMEGSVPPPEGLTQEELLAYTAPEGWTFYVQPGALLEERDGETLLGYVENPDAENLANLVAGYYTRQQAGRTRLEIQRYLMNRLVILQDGKKVYQSFNEDVHVAREPLAPIPGLPLEVGLDFGLTPAAVIGQNLRGRWLILDELVAFDMGISRFADQLHHLLSTKYKGYEVAVTGDPAGDQRAQTDEQVPFDILRGKGLMALPASSNSFDLRVEAVEAPLQRMVDGKPAFLLSPTAKHLRKAMAGGYHYPKLKVSGSTRYADRPAKNDSSHVADALQYLMLGGGEGKLLTRPKARGKVVTVQTGPGVMARKASTLTGRTAWAIGRRT